MANVGSAYVTIMPSMKGFASQIGSGFGAAGSEAGGAFGDGLSSGVDSGVSRSSGLLSKLGGVAATVGKAAVAGFSALTGAVTAVGGAALTAYADYEQLVGGVDTLFGSASGKLQEYASQAYKTAGMSANQYMTQATSFAASLVSSCGGDVAKAADYANMAMTDMSDNVNKMGSDMQSVQDAYQGFAKQNYTMLDNLKLGYGGTQAEMQRLIDDANRLRAEQGKNADLTIDSYADVVEAIHTVQDEMGITGTTAKEASTTISGSIGMAKAAWQNFLVGLADDNADFTALTTNLLGAIGDVAKNVAPRVAQIGRGIIEAFPAVLSGLGSVLAPVVSAALATAWNLAVQGLSAVGIQFPSVDTSQIMAAFQTLGSFVSSVFNGIGAAISTVSSAMAPAVAAIQAALAPVIESVSVTLLPALSAISTALGSLASALLPVFSAAIQAIAPVIGAAVGSVVSLVSAIAEGLAPIINYIAALIQAVLPTIQAIWTAWGDALKGVIDAVFPFIQTVVTTVMNVVRDVISIVLAAINGDWSAVWEGIKSLASSVWEGIKSLVSSAITAVKGTVSSVLGAIKSVWSEIWGSIKSFFGSIWDGIKSAAKTGIDNVYSTVTGFKDKVIGFFSGAGSWLINSGKAMLDGLTSGIKRGISSAINAVKNGLSQIRSFFPFSPAKRGPFSGSGYTTYSGRALMGDFAKSISSQRGVVAAATEGAMSAARGGFDASGTSFGGRGGDAAVYGGALEAIVALLREIADKDGDVYIDGRKVSSALYRQTALSVAGRGI